MILSAFTLFHVVISLIGIGSGLVVAYGLLTSNRMDRLTAVFLSTTALTSLTGFLFPVHKFMPSHAVGILSLMLLAFAGLGRYRYGMAGGWRVTYVLTSVAALYLNVFVLIVQSFEKVPALKALAPTQSEPPFQIAQISALAVFVLVGVFSAIKFHRERTSGARWMTHTASAARR